MATISTDTISEINFGSIASAGRELRELDPTADQLGPAVGAALQLSPTRAQRLVRGMIDSADDIDQQTAEVTALVEWSARESSAQRQVVMDGVRTSGATMLLVDRMARLPRTEARPWMADFLAGGGRRRDVASWLAVVGGVVREHGGLDPTHSGAVVDWIADTAEDAVDAISEAVETVVDALVEAGESIADVISEIIDFTAEQMANLVTALLEAGETIANLVVEAVEAGVTVLRKTVRALLEVGRTIAEVLGEVLEQAAGALVDVVRALRDIGESFITIIGQAFELAAEAFRRVVQTLLDIGRSVVQVLYDALRAAAEVLAATVRALLEIGRTVADLVADVVTGRASLLEALAEALREIGQTVDDLLTAAADAVEGAVRSMVRALHDIGASLVELAEWAVDASVEFAREVVAELVAIGETVVSLVTSLASRGLAVMTTIIDGLYAIGRTFAGLVEDLADVATDLLASFLEAAFELGATFLEFVEATVQTTYEAARNIIEAALEAGAALADLLVEAAKGTYYVLRRMVFGVLDAVGLGEVFDWALSQLEAGVTGVFREVMLAVRYAGQAMTDVLDWAADQASEAFEATVDAWESIGENLLDLYRWAADLVADAADRAWEEIGRATTRLHNSVSYVLNYLEDDFLPGVERFVRGLMEAGYELVDLVTRVVERSVELVGEVVAELLELGFTLTELFVAAMADPSTTLDQLVLAMEAIGQTRRDIAAAVDEAGEDVMAEFARTWARLEEPLADMLDAMWEVGGGAFGLLVAELFNTLGSYRPLTAHERAVGELVFEDGLDLDLVSISRESLDNRIIFGVQEIFQRLGGNDPDPREFVTGTLINIPADEGITDDTLVHELTHVWQNFATGPMYLSEAIHAQVTDDDAYNYGYTDDTTGAGAEDELQAADGDFESFNREQQGQIIMHWFRRHQDGLSLDDWQDYVEVVRGPQPVPA